MCGILNILHICEINSFPWDTIKFVTSGLTLVAFIILAILYYAKLKIDKEKSVLERVDPNNLSVVLQSLADSYHIDTSKLTAKETAVIVKQQLSIKSKTKRNLVYLVGFLGILLFVLALVAIVQSTSHISEKPPFVKKDSIPNKNIQNNFQNSSNNTIIQGDSNKVIVH